MDFLDKAANGFLHWFKGSLIWIGIALLLGIITTLTSSGEGQTLPAGLFFMAYGFWCVIYLPVRYLFLGYTTMRLRCKNCKAEWRIGQCANCQSTRFLANRCMRCGQYFVVDRCEECGVENMIRAKAVL